MTEQLQSPGVKGDRMGSPQKGRQQGLPLLFLFFHKFEYDFTLLLIAEFPGKSFNV